MKGAINAIHFDVEVIIVPVHHKKVQAEQLVCRCYLLKGEMHGAC